MNADDRVVVWATFLCVLVCAASAVVIMVDVHKIVQSCCTVSVTMSGL